MTVVKMQQSWSSVFTLEGTGCGGGLWHLAELHAYLSLLYIHFFFFNTPIGLLQAAKILIW